MEPYSEATKTVVILLTVKPSKIVRFKNTGVWLFTQSLGFTEVHFPTYLHGNCTLNEHLSYKRGVAGPKMATGSNYFKKL